MGEPFHNHFLKNLSGWWLMIEGKNHWKVPSPLPPLSLFVAERGRRKCAPLGIWRILVGPRFTISGCERECVCTKANDAEIFRFLAFEGEEDIPIAVEHYSRYVWAGTSCLTILVLVWGARNKEKQRLATRRVSYYQRNEKCYLPLALPPLVVTKVNILAGAGG